MSQLWLEILEKLGALRIPKLFKPRPLDLILGRPDDTDALDSLDWKNYLSPQKLFRVWGPLPDSFWSPYHCATLFAAIEKFRPAVVGPANYSAEEQSFDLKRDPPPWASEETAIIIDTNGPISVALAAWLASAAGYQPISTFNNWPDKAGLIKPEKTLAMLLRYASVMERARKNFSASSPPLWMCDRERLSGGPGRPRQFDNRYYIEESLLAGPEALKKAGIKQIVYLLNKGNEKELADLHSYFNFLRKKGIQILIASLESEKTLFEARPMPASPPLKTFSKFSFKRSSAGGFGSTIPEPSSSGS